MSPPTIMDTAARAAIPARAVVCAGGIETPYIRVGRGDPILLVVDDVDATGTQELMETLAARYVVFAAAPELRGDQLSRWRCGFVEALGVSEARLMVLVASAAAASR